MAIVGSIKSGLTGDHVTILTKSMLDMVMSVILTVSLGIGVALSAVSVFLYQGTLVLIAQLLRPLLDDAATITQIDSVGSIMIIAIGLNLMGITKIKVADMLPAIFLVILLTKLYEMFLL